MKLNSTSGVPIVGRRRGAIFTAPGATNIARARVVPLQPRSNAQVSTNIALAAAAQWWKLIDATDRALWASVYGADPAPYNAFVAINTNLVQWGLLDIIETPYEPATSGITVASLYAEPDGISTTLVVAPSGTPGPGIERWLRLYLNFQQRNQPPSNLAAKAVYFGSFGPIAPNVVSLFDVTDRMREIAGQWWYPGSVDTASLFNCGNAVYGNWWVTDQYGMPSALATSPQGRNQFCGVLPIQVGPGVCPSQPGPPYPWPTSYQTYGGSTLVNVRYFTTPGAGTYTPTPGTAKIVVQLYGAGGGGSGVPSPGAGNVALGGGGQAGGFLQKFLTAGFSGASFTVGTAGSGGAAGAHAGTAGGSTTFTTSGGSPVTYTAAGGAALGPLGPIAPPFQWNTGPGNSTSGGDISSFGQLPLTGFTLNVFNGVGQSGGLSPFGGAVGGQLTGNNTSQAGGNAAGPGGGGGGAAASGTGLASAGGNAGSGIVIIYEYT